MSLQENTMKAGKSILNPDAAPFLPVFSPEAENQPIKEGDENIQVTKYDTAPAVPEIMPGDSDTHIDNLKIYLEGSIPPNYDDTYENRNEMEEIEYYELALLEATFPGLSYQSLTDVYYANDGDLDESIEMLNQLESQPDLQNPQNLANVGSSAGSISASASASASASWDITSSSPGEASQSCGSSHPSQSK